MASCEKLIDMLHQVVDMLPSVSNEDDLWIVIDNFVRIINAYVTECVVYLDSI